MGINRKDNKEKHQEKITIDRIYSMMSSMEKDAKAYERFIRKPYQMQAGKVVIEEEEDC